MKKFSKTTRSNAITYGIVIVAYVIMQLLSTFGVLSSADTNLLIPICIYICMAVSLNLTVGILGELSLGHAGFMSVGAFTGIVVAMSLESAIPVGWIRLLIAIVAAAVAAGIAGVIIGIPVLRLRGDYLAIVTLAFGEIIKNLMNNLYVGLDSAGLHFSMSSANALNLAADGNILLNGPIGASGVTKLSTFFGAFLLILFTLFVSLNLIQSRTGRAIMAIRDNRIAAESVGLSITKYKLMCFVISAMLAGMAGALYGMNYTTLAPKKFDFNTSILILVFVVLGGMGNIRGSIIAATVLYMLPEKLRFLSNYRMLIYAIVLIIVMLATNNAQIRSLLTSVWSKFTGLFKKKKSPQPVTEGGVSDE